MQRQAFHSGGCTMQASVACQRPVPFRLNRKVCTGKGRPSSLCIRASAKAEELLTKGKERYKAKDLMPALKHFEDALKADPTTRQKQEAHYGCTAVHASFGDVELAQITLRAGLQEGLDYESALADPELPNIITSTQVMIQLRKFNEAALSAIVQRASRPPPGSRPMLSRAAQDKQDLDLSAILGSATGNEAEVDTSIPAIIRRVALLLLIGVLGGTGLFFIGLQYFFPK